MSSALRSLLRSGNRGSNKQMAVDALTRSLETFVDNHPLAHHFVVDAGRNWKDVWLATPMTRGERQRRQMSTEKAASMEATALTALTGDVDAFLLAISSAHLMRDGVLARRLLVDALQRNGTDGYSASLLLWVAFAEQSDGEIANAIATYQTAAQSPIAQIRRTALASGTFAAATTVDEVSLRWFLDRMEDEDEVHQQRVFEIVLTLRKNRAGPRQTGTSLRRIRRTADVGQSTSRWVQESRIV